MNDHNVFSIMVTSTPEASTNQWIFNITNLEASQAEFYANASGHYTAPSGITNAFQMLSNQHLESMGASAVIDAGLTNRSTVEFLFESIFYPEGPTPSYIWSLNQSYISITASSMVALSKGNITIQSNTMADAPIINPNVSPVHLRLSQVLHLSIVLFNCLCPTFLTTTRWALTL